VPPMSAVRLVGNNAGTYCLGFQVSLVSKLVTAVTSDLRSGGSWFEFWPEH
jgi:hypothetical protein